MRGVSDLVVSTREELMKRFQAHVFEGNENAGLLLIAAFYG
jgi:hypothetical protein